MNKKTTYIIGLSVFVVIALVLVFSSMNNKGDYIVGKEISGKQIPTIIVVQNISKKEADTLSLQYYMNNNNRDDVIHYHVKDIDLYNDLTIGERVTVHTTGYVMKSYPPQAVATEIIRHHKQS